MIVHLLDYSSHDFQTAKNDCLFHLFISTMLPWCPVYACIMALRPIENMYNRY